MPDGSSHGDGVLRLFNCPLWLNGALKFKSSLCLLQGQVCKRVEWQIYVCACKRKKILKKVEKKC